MMMKGGKLGVWEPGVPEIGYPGSLGPYTRIDLVGQNKAGPRISKFGQGFGSLTMSPITIFHRDTYMKIQQRRSVSPATMP